MKYLISIILFIISLPGSGQAYYINNATGNDNNPGTEAQPWASVGKASGTTFAPGSTVYLRAGQVFNQQLYMNASGTLLAPITFDRYGTGANPKIDGSSTLVAWTQRPGTQIWDHVDAGLGTSVTVLTINGVLYRKGRYPKTGYITNTAFTSTTITAPIAATPSYVGGQLMMRTRHWRYEQPTITAQSTNSITHSGGLVGISGGNGPLWFTGYGFWIQNHINALTQFGDWMYDAATGTVSLYLGSGLTPAGYTIKVSKVDDLLRFNDMSYCKVQNIDFEYAEDRATSGQNGSNVEVRNCNFRYIGKWGARFFTKPYTIFDGNTFTDCMNNGLDMQSDCSNSQVTNNTLLRVGEIAGGQGLSGENQYNGIFLDGNNTLIQYNHINGTGYNGIYCRGNAFTIDKNYVTNHQSHLHDGGGIYTFGSHLMGDNTFWQQRYITNNVIVYAIGAPTGTNETINKAMNIYLDEKSHDVTVSGNTMAFAGAENLFSHNSSRSTITGNVFYLPGTDNFKMRTYDVGVPITDVVFTGNDLFASGSGNHLNVDTDQGEGSWHQWGSSNNNRFAAPTDGLFFVNNYTERTFAQWKTFTGKDAASTNTVTAAVTRLEWNVQKTAQTITLDGYTYTDLQGNSYPNTITLQPYTSKILIRGAVNNGNGGTLKFHKLKLGL